MKIHPTAIIESGAQLAEDVEVGPYAYIGEHVAIGAGSFVGHHASVEGNTTLGVGNRIFPYASIGGQTQDLKYRGDKTKLIIGDNNIFREYVTIHSGTKEGGATQLGNDNAILAYSHVAHDCTIGNGLIMSSFSALAGYVTVGDYVNIAWNSGVHQFCKIGDYAMLAGSSKAIMDVLPFMIAEGQPARTRAFNKVNLERHGFPQEKIEFVKKIFRILFHSKGNRSAALARLKSQCPEAPELFQPVIEAIEHAERGFC